MSHGETAESLFDEVKALTNNDFSLAVFDVTDWNAQFSPWTAPAVFGKDSFSGKGNDTLRFLEDEFLPEIKSKFAKLSCKYPPMCANPCNSFHLYFSIRFSITSPTNLR